MKREDLKKDHQFRARIVIEFDGKDVLEQGYNFSPQFNDLDFKLDRDHFLERINWMAKALQRHLSRLQLVFPFEEPIDNRGKPLSIVCEQQYKPIMENEVGASL